MMKKIILLASIAFVSNLQAQFTVTKVGTSTQILNNSVLVFNTVDTNAAELKFNINNTTAADINVRIRCESITNANGTGMQFCFAGTCISDVAAGVNYPTDAPFYTVIPAMGNNGNFDHFRNMNAGNGTSTQDYVFKFYQVDGSGTEIGTSITMTYRYQPNLATTNLETLENIGIQLKSNVIYNQLDLNLTENTKLELFDTNGRLILIQNLVSGSNLIEVTNLNSSIYFVKFLTESGQTATVKVLKK